MSLRAVEPTPERVTLRRVAAIPMAASGGGARKGEGRYTRPIRTFYASGEEFAKVEGLFKPESLVPQLIAAIKDAGLPVKVHRRGSDVYLANKEG